MTSVLPVTGLSSERIAQLRAEAREIAGPFVDPRVLPEAERALMHVPADWREAITGHPSPASLRHVSWPDLVLILRASEADAAHLAARRKADRDAHEARQREEQDARAAAYRAHVEALSGPHRAAAARPVTGWQPMYHVPWSQVHPNSGGDQTGNVHLHAPDDVILTTVFGRRARITRQSGDSLCAKSGGKWNPRGGWMERAPEAGEAIFNRCPRCERLAERYGVAWPLHPTEETP